MSLLLSDVATFEDKLGYDVYARALSNLLLQDIQTPLTLGIHGDWGTGKTSLMRMLEWHVNPVRIVELLLDQGNGITQAEKDALTQILMNQSVEKSLMPDDIFKRYNDFRSAYDEWSDQAGLTKTSFPEGPAKEKYIQKKRDLFSAFIRPKQTLIDTVWFNAWEHDTDVEVWPALLNSVQAHLDKNPRYPVSDAVEDLKRLGKQGLAKLMRLATPVLTGGALQETGLEKLLEDPQTMLHYRESLQSSVRKIVVDAGSVGNFNSALLVFIDDLDRCSPNTVISLLERLKIFFDTKGCIFCLAASEEVIASGIEAKGVASGYDLYFKDKGRKYLEKIIQLPVYLPPLAFDNIRNLISGSGLRPEVLRQVEDIIRYIKPNPRLVKRFVNTFIFIWSMAELEHTAEKSAISPGVMAEILLIEVEWPEFYEGLIKYGFRLYDQIRNLSNPQFSFISNFSPNENEVVWNNASSGLKRHLLLNSIGAEVYIRGEPIFELAWNLFRDLRIWKLMQEGKIENEQVFDLHFHLIRSGRSNT